MSLNPISAIARADVSLTNGAEVNVRAGGSGNIAVSAGNFSMSGESTLRAGIAAGSGAAGTRAGNIDVNATGAIALDGDGTFLSNAVLENATGTGGDVNLTANSLTATNGVQIYAGTRGQADAGSVNMNVSNAASFDGAKTFSSGAYSRVESAGRGQGGSVNLTAGSLSVTNGAVLQASTFGRGNAGSVNINVRETAIFDGTTIDENAFSTGIYNRVETANSAVGEGGSINLVAGSLFVTGGAVITASTGAQGNAGNLTVIVRDNIILDGAGPLSPSLGFSQSSGLFSSVKETAVGEGGNIRISTRSLSVTNSALVIASALGKGNGGRILIDADTVNLAGVDDGQPSGIYNTTEPTATGRAGEITINANSLRVADGAVITSRTLNAGDGGNIAINARTFEAINGGQVLTTANSRGSAGNINLNVSESMMLSGSDRTFAGRVFDAGTNFLPNTFGAASGIYANTSANSTGAGGSLNVQTGQLTVREGAEVTVSSDGKGAAGNLRIDARSIRLDGGAIKATTQAGNFGNITLQAPDLRMQGNSQITTNAFGTAIGGNINIDTQFLIAKEIATFAPMPFAVAEEIL
ncbi:MAG: S-layer family protein [Microcoleus sp. SM1_3_4]|nr:S-layer family protein [Microcoleus sp. SM1_3_4]